MLNKKKKEKKKKCVCARELEASLCEARRYKSHLSSEAVSALRSDICSSRPGLDVWLCVFVKPLCSSVEDGETQSSAMNTVTL